MNRHHSYSLISDETGRLDAVASISLGIPRSVFSLDSAVITLNGKPAKKSAKVKPGDGIVIEYDEEVFEGLEGEDIPLSVIYEDSEILVIDKGRIEEQGTHDELIKENGIYSQMWDEYRRSVNWTLGKKETEYA